VRQVTAVEARLRHALVIHGSTENHRTGFGARGLDKTRDVGGVVLAVGVDLQRVRVVRAARGAQPRHDRGALAAVDRQTQQRHLCRISAREFGEHLLGRLVAAVVDDEDRQAVSRQICHGGADRVLVVVDRNHDAGSDAHDALSG